MKEIRDFENEVPEIVNEKCRKAYDQIRSEVRTGKYTGRIKMKAVIALCAAVVTACAVIPAAAVYIPQVSNIFKEESKVYSKDPRSKNDLSAFANPVNESKSAELCDITVSDVYFDGNDIAFTSILNTDAVQFKRCSSISAYGSIYVNGNLIEDEQGIFFGRDKDNVFTAVNYINVADLGIEDKAEIEVKLKELKGGDAYTMIYDNASHEYQYFETESYSNPLTLEFTANADRSKIKTYEVNETQGGFTLNSVTVSPFRTTFDITEQSDEELGIRFKDSNGIEYSGYDGYSCEAPLKDAKSITLEMFSLDSDDFPTVYSFTVPIEEGYRTVVNNEYKRDREIEFIPPEEIITSIEQGYYETTKSLVAEKAKIMELGEKMQAEYIDGVQATYDYRITGSEVIEDFSDYELEFDSEKYEDIEDPVMLLIDYEITRTGNEDEPIYFYGSPLVSEDFDDIGGADPDYMSVFDHGGKNAYVYDFELNETRTITVGYVMSKAIAEKAAYVAPIDGPDIYSLSCNITEEDEYFNELIENYSLMKIK